MPKVDASTNEMRQEGMAVVECQDVGGFEESLFYDGEECGLKACLLMEAVVGTWVSEGFLEEGTRQMPRFRGCVIGKGVIADGREGEVACIERLTE